MRLRANCSFITWQSVASLWLPGEHVQVNYKARTCARLWPLAGLDEAARQAGLARLASWLLALRRVVIYLCVALSAGAAAGDRSCTANGLPIVDCCQSLSLAPLETQARA